MFRQAPKLKKKLCNLRSKYHQGKEMKTVDSKENVIMKLEDGGDVGGGLIDNLVNLEHGGVVMEMCH